MTSKKTHPLSLPEIVLAIGKSIPLWVPEDEQGVTVWCLKPKDLVSAISVNHLFHTLLTPILWAIFAFPADHSYSYQFLHEYNYKKLPFHTFAEEIIEKNSIHFRYLDLTLGSYLDHSLQIETLQLSCTRLQELRLSRSADVACVGRLIVANPGLRAIYWDRSFLRGVSTWDLTPLFPLRQLRTLSLTGWALNSVQFHHILMNNATSLEEILLGTQYDSTFFLNVPSMNPRWDDIGPSPKGPQATEQLKAEAAQLMQGRRLLCPKVKSFELYVIRTHTGTSTLTLLSAFPALETFILGFVNQRSGLLLAQAIRENCPNIRSLQTIGLQYIVYVPYDEPDGMALILDACTPGNLDHISLARRTFDETFKGTLLRHGDRLEVLEIALYFQETLGVLENLSKVLEGCKRLKKFSMYNYRRSYEVQDVSILLEGAKKCHELEDLSLIGFPFIDTNEDFLPEVEYERMRQFLEDRKREIPASRDVLPAGWRYSERVVVGLNESVSTEELRRLAFEAVEGLSLLKTLVLNTDWFERDLK